MSLHVFAAFVTANGTAANNRGLTEGNITTLQKLVWNGQVHTTVSAESIRFALRRQLAESEPCNRTYDDAERLNQWKDPHFKGWSGKSEETTFIDDDLLGFMAAEAAKEENTKGSAKVRRAVLEVTRAVSLTPWPGDVTFNAASPGATPSAQKKGTNPVPYGTELHATRYQYGVALTPSALRVPTRAATALRALCALGPVAGNHGRFLFDFSPESVVFRLTQEPAPRILYAFQADEGGGPVGLGELVRKVRAGDIPAGELVLGGSVVEALPAEAREALKGATLLPGVRAACEAVCAKLGADAR
ncbi:type I-B CRISPR-associated protein Cas7/Cst2/DevR [Melittangium boletus]|uniref:type I-B CRISPR-associated protein Cas7/Cst2/DevR n=1 Tax=Melittangium boletus TaxID=83453 RepID=UPI003DA3A1E0